MMPPPPPPPPPPWYPSPRQNYEPVVIIVMIIGGFVLLAVAVTVLSAFLGALGVHPYEATSERSKCRNYEGLADGGDVSSMIEAGSCYDSGVEIPKDYVKARAWYEKAAAKGSAEAMDHIGQLYLHGGYGIQQDYAKARLWFEKGAEAGGTDAMRSLADIYWHGYGVEKDSQTGNQWRDRADQTQGDRIYHAERVKFEAAAAVGDVPAMIQLGQYYKGGMGVPRDYAKAREWWEKAAATGRTGSLEAMNELGDLYYAGGPGLKEDDAKAVEWYERAAAGGYRSAMCNLGRYYDGESHFHPNPEYPRKSKEWFDRCHEVVDGEAMH